jgi:phosphate-selective porin OprO/OprP
MKLARKFLLAALLCLGNTATADDTTILLRNVSLPNTEGGPDRIVSVLITNYRLDIITEDLIPLEKADEAHDARGGTLLGKLELGEPAGFLILSGDPRQDVTLLLDTKTHADFAIADGRVLKNRYLMLRSGLVEYF